MRPLVLLFACVALVTAADDRESTRDSGKDKPERRTHVRLAGISVGAGYARYSGYPWYPYGFGYPYYAPMWWGMDAFFHPGYWTGYRRGPDMGNVQLKTDRKDAELFIDGAFAGQAKDRRSIWLEPGAYNLELRAGGERFERRVYVLSGKTLRIDAPLEAKP